MPNMLPPDAVIVGYWDGEPIWRHKTPEEKLAEAGIDEAAARLGQAIIDF